MMKRPVSLLFPILAAVLMLPVAATAQITEDGAGCETTHSSGSTTISCNLTTGANANGLVVAMWGWRQTMGTIGSPTCTHNGDTMTQAVVATVASFTHAAVYYRFEPDEGAGLTVTCTSAQATVFQGLAARSYFEVDSTGGVDDTGSNTGGDSTLSLSDLTVVAANALVTDSIASTGIDGGDISMTAITNRTEEHGLIITGNDGVGASHIITQASGSPNMEWTSLDAAGDHVLVAASFAPVASAGDVPYYQKQQQVN